MKKFLSLFLMVSLLMTALVSCGSKEEEEEPLKGEELQDHLNSSAKVIFNSVNYQMTEWETLGEATTFPCEFNNYEFSFKLGEVNSDNDSAKKVQEYLAESKSITKEVFADDSDYYVYISVGKSSAGNEYIESVKVSKKKDMSKPYGQWPDPVEFESLVDKMK